MAPHPMTPDSIEQFRAICSEVGFDLDGVAESVLERMRLLAEHSETIDDAVRMAACAHSLFRWYEVHKPAHVFSEVEERTVVLGCLFSDLGKTGPEGADEGSKRLITEMFAIEGVHDDTQSVTTFLRSYFPQDATARLARFEALGLDPTMSIRQFWNLHSDWTLAIAETAGLPLEAVAAAASHHLLDGVNPRSIVADDHRFTRPFGENTSFDRAEKLVIVLDKYDAIRRRGQRSHDQAIVWLRERVAQKPRFCDDPELATLIADLDSMHLDAAHGHHSSLIPTTT